MAIKKTVKVHSISTIKPAEQIPHYVQFLSNYDQLFSAIPYYLQGVYYFRSNFSEPARIAVLIESLKQSLSKTLSVFRVVAGRVMIGKQSRLELDVNGTGIPFLEATADARIDDWPDLRDCSIEWELNPKDAMIGDYTTAPLARVQVTVFRCGGVSIGYSSAHVISDGLGAVDFVKAWGEIHRGLAISNPPIFDRDPLRARDPPRITVPVPDHVSSWLVPHAGAHHKADSESELPSRFQTIVFSFSQAMVDECVREVEQGQYRYGRATSFEALSALVWASVTRARSLADAADTNYSMPFSIRGRWEPSLPREFFGNAAAVVIATGKAGDIKSYDISYAAKLIHASIKEAKIEFLKSQVDWMEMVLQQGKAIGYSFDPDTGTDIDNTTFVNFPTYTINFGWGSPLFFAFSIPPHIGEGAAYILPSPDGGRSRDIAICLQKEHMKKLIEDKIFSKFRR
ncbi:hypothetical protein O6H91_Y440300 [Diphasiastrum complanatum]|nr:hypothetical protein O6H91_Y440300 [Diphasiastrum complanatum]KAJ7239934.1 hypothetical protein O6H91_Y440300 [Diphasiastrum complanatum]KAJ7239935.1 hypothetical protein O6H91_Y440300 [Diphasiastrum complanatum]